MRAVVADTLMRDARIAAALARQTPRRGGVTLTIIPVDGVSARCDPATSSPCSSPTPPPEQGTPLVDGDCLVVTQKVVSKAEGRLVALDADDRDARRRARRVESVRVLRRRGDLIISETRHGFVCANAGVDLSNVEDGLRRAPPVDADRSARHIRDALRGAGPASTSAVIVSDTFGRAWRQGLTDVAIGVAGARRASSTCAASTTVSAGSCQVTEVARRRRDRRRRGARDGQGAPASAAAIVRGLDPSWRRDGSVRELVRSPAEDLFR